ncbi:HAD family hydrolase [Streptomyces sp. NPDC049541]|uniref:HAD family hydrolase n=1 Tax=Streptomyces sp. NPDC049541 TaxID=3365594 RepID=UPI0037A5A4AD
MATQTENLQQLITRARYVLFDFDGPICRVFAGHSADGVARGLVQWLDGLEAGHLLTDEERQTTDPWDVLRAVGRRRPGSGLVTSLEERLTREELKAVSSSMPTHYADPLVRTWAASGAQLAVTTNNSPLAVRKYLEGRRLDDCFAHVCGRTRNPGLLKPHPHCLEQALRAFGATPSDALMLGDSPPDVEAARRAGVAFLGYARNERKEKELREAGAGFLVHSLDEVLGVLAGP